MSFPTILALEDGSIFYGEGFGEEKIDVGELVFNTSILHAVLPVKGLPIFRMIASFVGDI